MLFDLLFNFAWKLFVVVIALGFIAMVGGLLVKLFS